MKCTRRKLARDDRDRLRRLRRRRERVAAACWGTSSRIGPERPRRELALVLREARNAERVVDEQLVVALRDAHRRENRAGRVRPHQQVDLVDGDELLVERAREVGLRLVVRDDPLDRPAEQAVLRVQLVDVDLADDLVDVARRGQRAGERERAADADRRPRRRGERDGAEGASTAAVTRAANLRVTTFMLSPPC